MPDTAAILASLQAQLDALKGAASGANATPVNLPDDLPRNRDGMPEYATVLLTYDHLSGAATDNHIRNKMLYSTETMPEAIGNLLSYYGASLDEPQVMARVLELVGEAAKEEYNGGILVLFAPRNPHDKEDRGPVIETLMSTLSYYELIEHPDFGKGSSLLASDQVIRAVFTALEKRRGPNGEYPMLTYLKMLEADYPVDEPEQSTNGPHPCEALSDEPDQVAGGSSPRSRCYAVSDAHSPNSFTGGQQFEVAPGIA